MGTLLIAGCGGDDPVVLLARSTPYRLVEPRLSGPFPGDSCDGAPLYAACGLPEPGTPAFEALASASARARVSARNDPRRGAHAAALSELLWSGGDPSPLDRADSLLTALATVSLDDPDLLSDLAAVDLVRASGPGGALDAARALDHAEGALRHIPDHHAALFNRALALEALGVAHAAVAAWGAYLAADSVSTWAGEARTRRNALREHAAGASPASTPRALRELAMDSLLPEWGERADLLSAVDSIAGPLRDSSVRDIAADARAAVVLGRGPAFARALAEYGRARRHYVEGDDSAAEAAFAAARASVGSLSPVLAHWIDLWLAAIELGTNLPSARERTSAILEERSADTHPTLVGLAGWIRGVVEGREGRSARALRDHEAAVDAMDRSGEASYSAFLWSLTAEDRALLGDERGAWAARARAIDAFRWSTDSLRHRAALLEAAEALRRSGLHHAALRFVEAGMRAAPNQTAANLVAEALTRRAVLNSAVGDSAQARADLDNARRQADSVAHAPTRLRTLSDVWRASMALDALRPEMSMAVLAGLDSAIVLHEERGESYFLRDLYLDRARIRLRGQQVEAARADLQLALTNIDRGRDPTASPSEAVRLASTAERAIETVLELELTAAWAPWSALEALERIRAIATPWLGPDTGRVSQPERHVPPGTAVLLFAPLEDRLVTWVIRDDGRWAVSGPSPRAPLRTAVERLGRVAQRGAPEDDVGEAAEIVSRMLLPDTVLSLIADRDVILIPDATLSGTPFGLLRADGEWWIEQRAVAVSPSLALALAPPRPTMGESMGLLLAGDAVPAPSLAARFPTLTGARGELDALQEANPEAVRLDGAALTPAALLRGLQRPLRLFHFAGHAVATSDAPGGSHLVLSPSATDPTDPGLLTAEELASATIRGPETVVLTACQSVAPSATATGGFQGLALPFLRHGTQAVVGALWPVEDAATARLAVDFNRRLGEGVTAAEALRGAQAAAARDGSIPVSVWAAFQVVVGNGGRASVGIDAP